MESALVLGGGGVAGIAWMTGVLAGLADAGKDVTDADLVVGTSAGSTVAAQLGSGLSLEELFERQVDPALQAQEIAVEVDLETLAASLAGGLEGDLSPAELRRRIGGVALAAVTVPEADRRAVIASRLPSKDWSPRRIEIVAVDAETGEPVQFTRESGVELVDAVAASCAVPGIWPPVTIDGRRYVDGGVRSSDNADHATGARRITVLSPMLDHAVGLPEERSTREVVEALRAGGAEVTVIAPDAASSAAIGMNPLDPSTRGPAAHAGREQGAAA